MRSKQVQPDNHLQSAGECFMFLGWVESTMRDLLVLQEGGEQMREKYNSAYGKESHPSDFARRRLELGRLSFSQIKNRFFCQWPQWKNERHIHEAVERVVIYRNGFAHAQIQPFRNYLLYTPNEGSLKAIREYTKCIHCNHYLKDCSCQHIDRVEPLTLKFPCLEKQFVDQLYRDISTVDLRCLLPSAIQLNVAYNGIAWPTKNGHVQGEHVPK